jgi:homoserine O-acetyltransferase
VQHAQAPTRDKADSVIRSYLDGRMRTTDANDFLYQWGASFNYDPEPELGRIQAAVLAINAADDERNPPETGVMQAAMQRVAHGRLLLIPGSAETLGHGTTANAGFWRDALGAFLRELP